MMTDPIADMLTRIRNASMVGKREVVVPYSKMKLSIATILVREGYLHHVEKSESGSLASLVLTLQYHNGIPAVQSLKRVSTPGHRQYVKKDAIRQVLNGLGVAILSTPRGLLTDIEARQAKIGGELVCEVY
ncbi:MAG TPA: 30S ribosomal protein S8 [Patescibacteria group bacterium]|nr:30S ribosomal protein S8 [Patescibacteria group bacterium]